MLKSLSTQLAATLLFGPVGLAYSSVAAAVFFTLVMAVLYFTVLNILAVIVIWPVAIVAGLIFVKLHNDQITSSGSTLLLGPDDDEVGVSTLGSWGRGVAVLSILAVVGYLAFWYIPTSKKADEYASERSGTQSATDDTLVGSASSDRNTSSSSSFSSASLSSGSLSDSSDNSELAVAKTYPLERDSGNFGSSASESSPSGQSASSFSEVTFEEQKVPSVVIDSSSQSEVSGNFLYVQSQLVNLREGPGTNFSILTTVARGERLVEVDRAGSWIQIRGAESGATGWICNRVVSTQP